MVADGHALRRILDAHRDPLEMAGLVNAPLPTEIGEVLSLLAGQADRLHPVAECLEVSPDELLAAVRQYVREAMLFPDADDVRMLGLTLQSGPGDLKQHYRALQSWLHPDREGAPEDASALSARINAAWSRLRAASRTVPTGDDLVEFRPRWRKVEMQVEPVRSRWGSITVTAAIVLALGMGVIMGLRPDGPRTVPASVVVADSLTMADPVPKPTPEFLPTPLTEPLPSASGTETSDAGQADAIAGALPTETVGDAPSGGALPAADDSGESVPGISVVSALPESTVMPPTVAATASARTSAAAPVVADVAAATHSAIPANDAVSPAVVRTSISVNAPQVVDTQESGLSVAQTSETSALQEAVDEMSTSSPSSQAVVASVEVAIDETGNPASLPDAIDTARTDRARMQGASLLEFLTHRKPNVPPIWHSGSAFDQAEQARRTLTSGRTRPARALRDLEHWHIGAQHAEARIPVEPSDRHLNTQVVLVRLLWKNDDWWVENIGLETAK